MIGNSGEGEMRKVAIQLEQFRYVLALLFPQAKIETPVPTTIVLFKSHSSFNPYKPKYNGKTKENVGGYFLPGSDVNYMALTTELHRAEPYEVMFHEYEHFIIHNNLSRMPVWLDEGLAEFYSNFESAAGDQKFTLGKLITRHLRWPQPLMRYFQRQISVPELLALATDNDKQTEAYAYTGMDLSLSGKRER